MRAPFIRSSVRARQATGVIHAQGQFVDHNWADKFPKPRRGAKGHGIRFEARVSSELSRRFPDDYIASFPFRFLNEYGSSICVPDGLLFHGDKLIICEVKLRHCGEAWHQLRKLYNPVIHKAWGIPTRLLEICKWYNPDVSFPEPFLITTDLEHFLDSGAELGCWIWGRD